MENEKERCLSPVKGIRDRKYESIAEKYMKKPILESQKSFTEIETTELK